MILTYKDPNKINWFLISWTLSNKCNYRCSYCPSFLHDGSSGWPEWNAVQAFVNNLNIDKEICFRISGGEPTYWKHFVDFAKLIKSAGHTFSFLTNGSQSDAYYQSIADYSDGIIFSYHHEYSTLEEFKIKCNLPCPTIVNLMLTPSRFDELVDVAKELFNVSNNITIWPKLILDKTSTQFTNEVAGYTDTQKTLLDNWPYFRELNTNHLHRGKLLFNNKEMSGNDLLMKKLNRYKGWTCWAGLHTIAIDQYGDIFRGDCQHGGKIGTISSFTLPSDTIICPAESCNCLGDIYLQKVYK